MNGTTQLIAFPGTTENSQAGGTGGETYRPAQWSSEPILTYIKDPVDGTLYYFDAVIKIDHNRSLRTTDHPVQSGANITDHSFMMPARLSMEIGMSDSMTSYQQGQWDGGSSRSVNAYLTLLNLQKGRLGMTVSTRLDSYENMVIEQIGSQDDYETKYGLKVTVIFKQIITAVVGGSLPISANPQASQQNKVGTVYPTLLTPQQQKDIASWRTAIPK